MRLRWFCILTCFETRQPRIGLGRCDVLEFLAAFRRSGRHACFPRALSGAGEGEATPQVE
jgi:hypothetical protein